jgi:proline iminopeptidase
MNRESKHAPRSLLKRLLLWLVGVIAVVIGLSLIFTVVCYLVAETPEPMSKTVVDDPSLPFMDVNGVKLHLQTFGDPSNPVVIVLHGGPGDDHLMLLELEPLSDEYFLVFYDQRGSGLSQRVSDEDLSYEGMLEEMGAIIDHFSPDKPVRLFGHSWGAMLSSGYIGQHPDRVLQAVLAEPGFLTPEAGAVFLEVAGMPEPSLELATALWWIFLESLHLDGPDDDARADYMMLALVMTEAEDHPMGRYFCEGKPDLEKLQHFRFGTRANMVVQSKAMADDGSLIAPFADGVGAFPNKVLFMVSECNTAIGAEHQKKFHLALFDDAELVVIEDAGHIMMGDQPERTIQAIREYFAEAQPAVEEEEAHPEQRDDDGNVIPKEEPPDGGVDGG